MNKFIFFIIITLMIFPLSTLHAVNVAAIYPVGSGTYCLQSTLLETVK